MGQSVSDCAAPRAAQAKAIVETGNDNVRMPFIEQHAPTLLESFRSTSAPLDKTLSLKLPTATSQPPTRRAATSLPIPALAGCQDLHVTLPEVEITVRINRLANFDVKAQRVHVDFLLMMDWMDESLVGKYDRDVDWDEAFVPKVSIDNAASEMEPDNVRPRIYDATSGWARMSARYRGELLAENLDMQNYPFDCQELRIQIKSLRWKSRKVRLSHPALRRGSETYRNGHKCGEFANQLDAWQLSGPLNYSAEQAGEHYIVKIALRRRCNHALMNVCLPVFLINVLSFAVFVIDAADLCSRLQITLTWLLTITTFKSSVATELPVYSYLTTMDKYFVYSMFVSFANAAEHTLIAALLLLSERDRELPPGAALDVFASVVLYRRALAAIAGVFGVEPGQAEARSQLLHVIVKKD
eukprot:TRINITY_DN38017_c0_g1_i1.p1 TRINITY_DN38017_c0_g1~~TRINITY_DN38017_c0_g1_i1.p1  ORF type:complete len:413 (+),score=54.15 TRINITY_DN38017_c0_g1_i1:57-1295(+)